MIILSVDYGDTRTGIAVCDKTEFLASPVTVITEKESEPLIEKITEIIVGRRNFFQTMDTVRIEKQNIPGSAVDLLLVTVGIAFSFLEIKDFHFVMPMGKYLVGGANRIIV